MNMHACWSYIILNIIIVLYGNRSPSGTVWLVRTYKPFSSTKCWVRVSHKEHHRGDEFHVILRERIGRDGDVEVSPGKVASLAFKKSNRQVLP